jgi:hypothetical protein
MAKHTIRTGDTVIYSDPNRGGRLNRAVCAGHGWHKGRRVVHLDNGVWCYREDVASVERGARGGAAERLMALAEGLGLEPADLDDAVHDLAQEVGLGELNGLGNAQDQEEHIAAQEASASHTNNGGLDAQVAFLLEHNGHDGTRRLLEQAAAGKG